MSTLLRAPMLSLALAAGLAVWGCGGDVSDDVAVEPSGEGVSGARSAASSASPEKWVPLPAPPAEDPGASALFDSVTARARSRAAEPWTPPDTALSSAAGALTYAQYRGIRFRDEATLWRDGGPFRLQLFHPGGGFRVPVTVVLVDGGGVETVGFDAARFDYGDEVEGMELGLPRAAGHAGLRLLHPLNDPDRWDEVVSFLGASYFRLLGPGQVYGLSARGLAVGVGAPEAEEFPDFTRFWVVRPPADGDEVTIVALLEGPSVTGAYRFVLAPGSPGSDGVLLPTVVDVDVRLFARRDLPRLGMAPLTSMYLHGTFRTGGDDDVRPRVHDSQGLLMHTGDGEWIWRPLTNRAGASFTSLRDVEPRGFGLVQRDRDFASYLDLEAQYHRRPSLWVEPLEGEWGGGGVQLVELPSPSEFNDNIVAYWAPDGGMEAGESRAFSYRLTTFDAHLAAEDLMPVVRTRVGWDALPGQADPPPRSRRRVVVDFGPAPRRSPEAPAPGGSGGGAHGPLPQPVLQISAGRAEDLRVEPLPGGGVRATFALVPSDGAPADMRLHLTAGGAAVSETWSWLWRADDGV